MRLSPDWRHSNGNTWGSFPFKEWLCCTFHPSRPSTSLIFSLTWNLDKSNQMLPDLGSTCIKIIECCFIHWLWMRGHVWLLDLRWCQLKVNGGFLIDSRLEIKRQRVPNQLHCLWYSNACCSRLRDKLHTLFIFMQFCVPLLSRNPHKFDTKDKIYPTFILCYMLGWLNMSWGRREGSLDCELKPVPPLPQLPFLHHFSSTTNNIFLPALPGKKAPGMCRLWLQLHRR